MTTEDGNCEILPLVTTLRKILADNYILPKDEMSPIDLKRLLRFALPLIIGGIPFAIGSMGYVYISMKRDLWPQPLESVLLLIQMLTTVLVLIIFISNTNNYLISINRLSRYFFGAPKKCKEVITISDRLSFIAYNLGRVAVILQALLFYCFEVFCEIPGFEGDDGFICGLMSPLWFPFKVDYPFVHLILRISILYVSVSYLPILLILVVNPLTTNYLTVIRIREFRKIIYCFNQTSGDEPLSREQLVYFIKYHEEIAECLRVSNNSISYDHLPIQIFLPIILALYTHQIVRTHDVIAVGYLILWFFPYVSLCVLGEVLEYESSIISGEMYGIRWYNIEDAKVRTLFRMFLFVLNRPVKLKLKPLAALNHQLIIKIVKTAYSFLIFFVDTLK